ncbi:MAG: aminopeptidase [Bacteroidetes bacterium]|nr:aminopeptidase [Bacteroidota bacterium]
MSRYGNRVARLRTLLEDQRLDALIVTSLTHLHYLTGFTGSNGLAVVTRNEVFFLTDSRYRAQAARQVRNAQRLFTHHPLLTGMAEHHCLSRCKRAGFESHVMTYQQYRLLRKSFPRKLFVPTSGFVEKLLLVKDDSELSAMRKAIHITDLVYADLLTILRPGMREHEVAAEISYRQRRLGAEGDAFHPIVASGERGALPHARASEKKLRRGEMVTLDFGATVDGYHSDLTRTVALGHVTRRAREIYGVVLKAQLAALDAARGGMPARDLDGVARRIIADAGYGDAFSHSLGHGLGLHIHERPRVSALSNETLAAGSVITVEPGIYIPGWGGVRIEDDILLSTTGNTVLTSAPKDLVVL